MRDLIWPTKHDKNPAMDEVSSSGIFHYFERFPGEPFDNLANVNWWFDDEYNSLSRSPIYWSYS